MTFRVSETAIMGVNLGDLTRSKAYDVVYPAPVLSIEMVMGSGRRSGKFGSLLCL